jgi:hypothetical protein
MVMASPMMMKALVLRKSGTLLRGSDGLGALVTILMVFAISVLSAGLASANAPEPNDEYIIVSGGPALLSWEQYRAENQRHDRWWGNFVRTARIRVQQLQKRYPSMPITWLVYRPGYVSREAETGEPLISNIESVRDAYGLKLVYFDTTKQLVNYVNSGRNRRLSKVNGFEYFGHSNKFCFVFDYSNHVLGASRCFLHQSQVGQFNRSAFAKNAYCRSWGCHSGEAFCGEWKKATGVKMSGAIGKTDYSESHRQILPFISSAGGRWVE